MHCSPDTVAVVAIPCAGSRGSFPVPGRITVTGGAEKQQFVRFVLGSQGYEFAIGSKYAIEGSQVAKLSTLWKTLG